MLKNVKVGEDNYLIAAECYHKIFSWLPIETDPFTSFVNSTPEERKIRESMEPVSYIVYDDEKIVGLVGKYSYPTEPESAWLGWFGVLPEFRRDHYGSRILKLHEETIKAQGYKYSRLYTETFNNDAARNFYERNGYTGELYNCPEEKLVPKDYVTIYTKSLGDFPVKMWDNKNMMLSELEAGMVTEDQLKDLDKLLEEFSNRKHI